MREWSRVWDWQETINQCPPFYFPSLNFLFAHLWTPEFSASSQSEADCFFWKHLKTLRSTDGLNSFDWKCQNLWFYKFRNYDQLIIQNIYIYIQVSESFNNSNLYRFGQMNCIEPRGLIIQKQSLITVMRFRITASTSFHPRFGIINEK